MPGEGQLATIDVELHLLDAQEVSSFRETFSSQWVAGPLRAPIGGGIPELVIAGAAVISAFAAKLEEVVCRKRGRALLVHLADVEPVVMEMRDLEGGRLDLGSSVLTGLPGGTLIAIKADGSIERHDVCKKPLAVAGFLARLGK